VTCKSQEHVRYLQRYCKTLATWLYILYGIIDHRQLMDYLQKWSRRATVV